MAEYTNREELRAAMQHIYNDPTCPMHIAAEIEQIIDCAPAADVAAVVRCQDCKWSRPLNKDEKEQFVSGVLMCTCSEVSECGVTDVWATHFCSYGERKCD